jgi:hypothetical protein
MRKSVRSLTAFQLIGALTAIWLAGSGSALAGGGIDAGAFQTGFLDPLCKFMGITSTCPTLPTGTQIVLELSALGNRPPGLVRFGPADFRDATTNQEHPSGGQVESCNVSGTSTFLSCNSIAVDTANPPGTSLDNLTPLGFISQQNSLTVAQPGTFANSLFYAVADQAGGLSTHLTLIYDFLLQTNSSFSSGQTVANISLPFGKIVGTTETFIPATLQLRGKGVPCSAIKPDTTCLTANVVADFLGSGTPQTYTAAALGVTYEFDFNGHAMFKVTAPLLVTQTTDPAYHGVAPPGSGALVNQLSGLPTAFSRDVGFSATVLSSALVGIVPYASPQGAPATKKNNLPNFPFCASFSTGTSGGSTVPAVAAFGAIGTDGTVYTSAPVTTVATCPF